MRVRTDHNLLDARSLGRVDRLLEYLVVEPREDHVVRDQLDGLTAGDGKEPLGRTN